MVEQIAVKKEKHCCDNSDSIQNLANSSASIRFKEEDPRESENLKFDVKREAYNAPSHASVQTASTSTSVLSTANREAGKRYVSQPILSFLSKIPKNNANDTLPSYRQSPSNDKTNPPPFPPNTSTIQQRQLHGSKYGEETVRALPANAKISNCSTRISLYTKGGTNKDALRLVASTEDKKLIERREIIPSFQSNLHWKQLGGKYPASSTNSLSPPTSRTPSSSYFSGNDQKDSPNIVRAMPYYKTLGAGPSFKEHYRQMEHSSRQNSLVSVYPTRIIIDGLHLSPPPCSPSSYSCLLDHSVTPPSPAWIYILTHFHSDHYRGLSQSWKRGPLLCSPITARLVNQTFRLSTPLVTPIPLHTRTLVFPPIEADYLKDPTSLKVKKLRFSPSPKDDHQQASAHSNLHWAPLEILVMRSSTTTTKSDGVDASRHISSTTSLSVAETLPEPFIVTFVDANHCPGAILALVEKFPFRGIDLSRIVFSTKDTYSLRSLPQDGDTHLPQRITAPNNYDNSSSPLCHSSLDFMLSGVEKTNMDKYGDIYLHTGDMRYHSGMRGLFQPYYHTGENHMNQLSETEHQGKNPNSDLNMAEKKHLDNCLNLRCDCIQHSQGPNISGSLGLGGDYPYPSSILRPGLVTKLGHFFAPPPRITAIYLDNTYCSSGISFPRQSWAISKILKIVAQEIEDEKSRNLLSKFCSFSSPSKSNHVTSAKHNFSIQRPQSSQSSQSLQSWQGQKNLNRFFPKIDESREIDEASSQVVGQAEEYSLEIDLTQEDYFDIEEADGLIYQTNSTCDKASLETSFGISNLEIEAQPFQDFLGASTKTEKEECGYGFDADDHNPTSHAYDSSLLGQSNTRWGANWAAVKKRPKPQQKLESWSNHWPSKIEDDGYSEKKQFVENSKRRSVSPTLILVGSYAVGKERILIQLYKYFGLPIFASQARLQKLRIVCQAPLTDDLLPLEYCEDEVSNTSETLTDKGQILDSTKPLVPFVPAFRNLMADSIFTRDQALSRIHIVPLQVVSSAESIAQYLHSVPNYIQDGVECFRYNKVVAIRPTGWSGEEGKFVSKKISLPSRAHPFVNESPEKVPKFGANTENQNRGEFSRQFSSSRPNLFNAPRTWVTIDMHSVPYSEHSSYDELVSFLDLFSPHERDCTERLCATSGISSTQTSSNVSALTLTKCSQTYSPLVVGTVRGKNWRQGNNSSTSTPSHHIPLDPTSSYDLLRRLVHTSLPASIVD